MIKPLLIEIGVEELPAIPLLKELKNIEPKWLKVLEKYNLVCDFELHYTPRRLVLWHREFKTAQEDSIEELFGAPIEIAIKDGEPTAAALGFAKKCGVEFSELSTIEKGGKEVLYYKKDIVGKSSTELLEQMIDEWIKSLSFGKSMRWGSNSESFIRPIRWVSVILADELVDVELFGVKSSAITYLHRSISYEPQPVSIDNYFDTLRNGGVELFSDNRKNIILNQFKLLESEHNITIDIDDELLDEVVAITESPKALLGRFDEEFLTLPPEVIITSMKEHQRYFGVFRDGKLLNNFVVVSNAICDDYTNVIEGNERVLRPRLSDGLFFYNNDIERGLSTDGLERVVFIDGLGSMSDKIEREIAISKVLSKLVDGVDESELNRAMSLAKADLMSEMVYEFTELQGVMGYYYALKQGESESVAVAIKEQYLPTGENSTLPSTPLSAIIALSIKLDTLLAIFSIDQIPTGSRDPFALRRAVNGIIKIALEFNIKINFSRLADELSSLYKKSSKKEIEHFVIERLNAVYPEINPSIISSVVSKDTPIELDILSIDKKIKAINSIANSSSFSDAHSTFKRVANILKDFNSNDTVDESLLVDESEKTLYIKTKKALEAEYIDYEQQLDALFALRKPLSHFFDSVMVNDPDTKIATNRKALVAMLYSKIYEIADIKNISI